MKSAFARGALVGVCILVSAVGSAGPAHAQAWIGQIVGNMIAQEEAARQRAACMSGTAMPDSEIVETRPTAYAAMAGYWQAVRGGAAADATSYFIADAKVGWTSGVTKLSIAGLAKVSDPFAISGAAIGTEPTGYVRSGDGRTVWGQWRVQRADGSLIGTYDAMFRRTGATWKLTQLTLVPATVYLNPVVQFCSAPNDVMAYRLASTQYTRDHAVKRADKLKAKADKARADADKAAAKGDAVTIADTRLRAGDADKKATGATEMARLAIEANELAKADAAAAEERKTAAIAALSR